MEPLSRAQKRVYDALKVTIQETGTVPTHAELADFLGYHSTSSVHSALAKIKAKGWIDWPHGERRAIKLLPIVGEDNTYIPALIEALKRPDESSEDVIMKGLRLLQSERLSCLPECCEEQA